MVEYAENVTSSISFSTKETLANISTLDFSFKLVLVVFLR